MSALCDLPERFQQKIQATDGDCWEWTGCRDRWGYGLVSLGRRAMGAHRATYQLLVGEIPAGLQLDHLCRNPACVNPTHLEPVTPRENVRRSLRSFAARTHCLKGAHELTPENVYAKPGTGRSECRACRAAGRARASATP